MVARSLESRRGAKMNLVEMLADEEDCPGFAPNPAYKEHS